MVVTQVGKKVSKVRDKMAVFTAGEALEMALKIEENGEAFYNAIAERSEDAHLQALCENLAVQERAHHRTFERMLGEVKPAPHLPAEQYEDYQAYLNAALDQSLFAGPDKALALAEKVEDPEEALQMAIGFEKDTMLFYYDLRDMVSESDREAVSGIIREEKTHLRRLASKL